MEPFSLEEGERRSPFLGPRELRFLVTEFSEQSYSTSSHCPFTKGSSRDLITDLGGEEGIPDGVGLQDYPSVLEGRPKIGIYMAACPRPYPESGAAVAE